MANNIYNNGIWCTKIKFQKPDLMQVTMEILSSPMTDKYVLDRYYLTLPFIPNKNDLIDSKQRDEKES